MSDRYGFLSSPEEYEAEEKFYEKYKTNVAEAVLTLEEKYKDRGLEFTEAFNGACPVQAFGNIHGMRFYFRYRYGIGELTVGTRDFTVFEERKEQRVAQLQKRVDEAIDEADKIFFNGMVERERNRTTSDDDSVIPEIIVQVSEFVFSDNLDGILIEVEEMVEVFSNLVDSLQEVD